MTCAVCVFYDVCIIRNTDEACTHSDKYGCAPMLGIERPKQ